jgi:hypothetical protein
VRRTQKDYALPGFGGDPHKGEMPPPMPTPHDDYVFLEHPPTEVAMPRVQVGGDHYTSLAIQPFDIIAALGLDFFEGNALKYLLRYHRKGSEEDLQKCQHYIDILMAREKGVKEWWKTAPRQ